ncbi:MULTISPECIES: ammonium transporter [unclassified Methylophaga]|jgi:ammonia channel protein AmtB|uniref:ammonium transporter n=1 Tax=unclassified Methylophaga TaxID=2629249 RepID=UPI000C8D1132|nr:MULTISPECIES: ammonium transporter [unclassified Methylophaga]MAK66646.1 ammonium transporter [Methylophaga sp.]MAY18398.1 ammonium transporter [Methylophaga sp.]MBN46625.1 ammonium transporter [Methylophaga sp.]|tara:strand:+ start:3295 stop:4662 length:1368 start_codon:yes stop_codon:yes gene_type:complete
METEVANLFAEQVSLGMLVQNLVYASGTVGAIFVVIGLMLIDVGGVRRRNIFNATIEKMVGFFIGFTAYFLIGFAFWASQYYIMEGYTLVDTMKDWWAGGALSNAMAQNVDPAVFPGLNNFQIFIFFLACFAGIVNVLLHFAVSERMKASAYYITAFVATIVSSILSWLTWGSVGPLTNMGFHDFFGVGFVYLFPAGMAMVFVRKLRPRPGMFTAHPNVSEYRPPNLGLLTVGVMTIFAGLPMVILSCLFFFDPEALAVSVTMADTSVGIAFNNYGAAWAGGALMGAILAYSTRKFSYLLLGPLAGYVAGASGFDVYVPWQMFLVALGAPVVAYLIYEFMQKRNIDEHKLLPLFAGVGSYGLIMTGLLHIGVPRGGYLGIEEGIYAFQHGEIGVLMQVVGIVVSLGFGIVTALVMSFILKHTIGMDVSDDAQAEGLDKVYWDIEPDVDPVTDNKP